VASACDSLPEILGGAGVLVPASDPAALGQALVTLLESADERERLRHLARRRAALFSVESMVRAYEEIYDSLLAPGPVMVGARAPSSP